MAQMPVEQRLAFRERRQVIGVDQLAHRDRAQIGDDEFVAGLERFDIDWIERDRKSRRLLQQTEKCAFSRLSPSWRASAGVNSGSCRCAARFSATSSPPTT